MLTIQRASKSDCMTAANTARVGRHVISMLLISGTMLLGVTGCGQKGALYLEESSSQAAQSSSEMLKSSSHPQDAAFAGVDDDTYQKNDYLDEQQILPEPSTDPNDY